MYEYHWRPIILGHDQYLLFWGMTNTYCSGAWPWPLERVYRVYQYIVQLFTMTCTGVDTDTHTDHTNTHTHTSMHKYIYDVNIDWYINRMARGGKVDRIWSVPCEGFCLRFLKYAQKWTKHMRNEKQWEGIGFPILSPWQPHRPQIPPRFCPIDPIVLESLALASQCTDKSTWLSKEREMQRQTMWRCHQHKRGRQQECWSWKLETHNTGNPNLQTGDIAFSYVCT